MKFDKLTNNIILDAIDEIKESGSEYLTNMLLTQILIFLMLLIALKLYRVL